MSEIDPGSLKEPSGREKFMDFLQEVKIELVGAKEEFEVRCAWVCGGVGWGGCRWRVHFGPLLPTTQLNQNQTKTTNKTTITTKQEIPETEAKRLMKEMDPPGAERAYFALGCCESVCLVFFGGCFVVSLWGELVVGFFGGSFFWGGGML